MYAFLEFITIIIMCQAAVLLGGPFPFIFLHNTKELNAGGQI